VLLSPTALGLRAAEGPPGSARLRRPSPESIEVDAARASLLSVAEHFDVCWSAMWTGGPGGGERLSGPWDPRLGRTPPRPALLLARRLCGGAPVRDGHTRAPGLGGGPDKACQVTDRICQATERLFGPGATPGAHLEEGAEFPGLANRLLSNPATRWHPLAQGAPP
jgi:hypothetical protein